jgi:glycerol-3-phosphate acyltransferase PlsX
VVTFSLTSTPAHIRIAVDAMGGDFAPRNVVRGAVEAARESGGRFTVVLVGDRGRIEQELAAAGAPTSTGIPVEIVHAPDVIEMSDSPTAALRSKRESSIAVGLRLHQEGNVHAFLSAGNTGAVMSASTLILGRITGVSRPTIGAVVPTAKGPCMLLDAGANVDSRPQHLLEFGIMGSIYASSILGRTSPRVGLLNIGEEETKGTETVLAAFTLLRQSGLNFVGNVEGRDLLTGEVDVAVCDGFVGNVLLKFGESVPAFLKSRFLGFAEKSFANKMVALVARGGLRSVLKELDYQEHGGVPLLGVNGVSIIGHGGSTPKAIKNMVYRAEEMVQRGVNLLIQKALTGTHA